MLPLLVSGGSIEALGSRRRPARSVKIGRPRDFGTEMHKARAAKPVARRMDSSIGIMREIMRRLPLEFAEAADINVIR